MESNKLVGVAVTATVMVILLGALLVPVLNDYTDTETTTHNEGMRASLYVPGETHTIYIDKNGIKTDDGPVQPLPTTYVDGEFTLIFGSNIARFTEYGAIREYLHLSGTYSDRRVAQGLLADESATIEINAEGLAVITGTSGDAPRAMANVIMYPDANGAYSLSKNPYVIEGSQLYGAGNTTVGSVIYGLTFAGPENDLEFNMINPIGGSVADYSINKVNTATNLYKIEEIDINVEGEATPLAYSYFFAPYEITYENPGYIGSGNSAILIAIPTIIIASMLVAVIYGIRMREN